MRRFFDRYYSARVTLDRSTGLLRSRVRAGGRAALRAGGRASGAMAGGRAPAAARQARRPHIFKYFNVLFMVAA